MKPRDPGGSDEDAEAEAVICRRNNGIYSPCMAVSLRRPGPGNTRADARSDDVTSDEHRSRQASDIQQQTWLGSRNCNQNSSRCCLLSREAAA